MFLMKTLKTKAIPATRWFGCAENTLRDNSAIGHYLYYDGRLMECTEFGQEKAICLGSGIYFSIEPNDLPLAKMSSEEVKEYAKMHNLEIPCFGELLELAKNWKKVNTSLGKIRPMEALLSQNVLNEMWFAEELEKDVISQDEESENVRTECKRLIIIKHDKKTQYPKAENFCGYDVWVYGRQAYILDKKEYILTKPVLLGTSAGTSLMLFVGAWYSYLFTYYRGKWTFWGASAATDFEFYENNLFSYCCGLFQFYGGKLNKLYTLRFDENNPYNGCEQAFEKVTIDEDNKLNVTVFEEIWCGEQRQRSSIEMFFILDEKGFYKFK